MIDVINNRTYYYHYDGLGSVVALSSTDPCTFKAVAAGAYHSIALKTDGTIIGWGQNRYGQATPPEGNDFNADNVRYLSHIIIGRIKKSSIWSMYVFLGTNIINQIGGTKDE